MSNVVVGVEKGDFILPEYKSDGAVGFDIAINESILVKADTIENGKVVKHPVVVGTGIKLEIPLGYEVEIRSRSSIGFNLNLLIHNGTIDYDYRGEIKLKIWNMGNEDIHLQKGYRVAQGILKHIPKVKFEVKDKLSDTNRGTNGFGSTGCFK
jgi:dUTP pyrophosphatase